MSPLRCDPHYVLDQYEALRREATAAAPFGPRGHGLALFLNRGMSGWLAALTALAPSGPPLAPPLDVSPRDREAVLPASVRAELTAVLAGMVLACTQGEGVGG